MAENKLMIEPSTSFVAMNQIVDRFSGLSTTDASESLSQYGEIDSAYYPRCEYKTRFKETSIFEMSDEKYHSTYFRSTQTSSQPDRLTEYGEKLFDNENLMPYGQKSKTGAFRSPWSIPKYKAIFDTNETHKFTTNRRNKKGLVIPQAYLYDKLLAYKLKICNIVASAYTKKVNEGGIGTGEETINVYVRNDYPCVMVQVIKIGSPSKNMHKIMDRFTTIVNSTTIENEIPIELIVRSSFGHNNPSIADTHETFRINIGVVPEVYATIVLAESLVKLSKDITAFVEVENEVNLEQSEKQSFPTNENSQIKEDDEFWGIIKNMSSAFEERDINTLKPLIDAKDANYRQIRRLYAKLEEANLRFIRSTGSDREIDGFGSDSDCGISFDNRYDRQHVPVETRSKKIIVSTGIRAIYLAHYLVTFFTGAKPNTDYMYFETKTLQLKTNVVKVFAKNQIDTYKNKQEEVRYIDLNHCCASGSNSTLNLKAILEDMIKKHDVNKNNFIVFDYTSATTQRIREAIELFIPIVDNIVLVSSGLKNEQLGADTNPYGTIRFICARKNMLRAMYSLLKTTLHGKEELPKELHAIRKSYKGVGAVVTSKSLFENCRYYRRRESNEQTNVEEMSADNKLKFRKEFVNIVNLFDNYKNIIRYDGLDLTKVLEWSEDDKLFFDSKEVASMIHEGPVAIHDVMRCYFNDRNYWRERVKQAYKSINEFVIIHTLEHMHVVAEICQESYRLLHRPDDQPIEMSEKERKMWNLRFLADRLNDAELNTIESD